MNYNSAIGALLVGCVVGAYLFGINTSQAWVYLRSYPNDRWQMKTFIIVLWFLEFVHTLLTAWMVYELLVVNVGTTGFTQPDLNMLYIINLISVNITSLVQFFFAYRLHKLSNFVVIPLIATTISLVRLSWDTGATIRHIIYRLEPQVNWGLVSIAIMTITSDLLVAGALSYSLWRRRTLWRVQFDLNISWWPRIIDQLIIISLQADAFICMISTTSFILYHVSSNYSYLALSLVACRLFSISCLSSMFSGRNLSQKRENMPSLAVILESAVNGFPPV